MKARTATANRDDHDWRCTVRLWAYARIDYDLIRDDSTAAGSVLPSRVFEHREDAQRAAEAERAQEHAELCDQFPSEDNGPLDPLIWTRAPLPNLEPEWIDETTDDDTRWVVYCVVWETPLDAWRK